MSWFKIIVACGFLWWPSLEAMEAVGYCWNYWYQGSLVSQRSFEKPLLENSKISFEDNDASIKSQKIDRFDPVNNQANNQDQGSSDREGLDVSWAGEIWGGRGLDDDCECVDYAAVVDKKAALDGAAVLVASGVSDCDSAFYLAVDAFIDECVENSIDFEVPRKLLCRALLQRYVRERVVIVDEPEKLCKQIESNQIKDRCKAAVQLYYLSLQAVERSNSEEGNRICLLSIFYWLDEKPCAQWYKVFNNHLKLLLRRRYSKAQKVSLKLFEAYKDLDTMRNWSLRLFSELYLSGYSLKKTLVKSTLDSIVDLLSDNFLGDCVFFEENDYSLSGLRVTDTLDRLVVENNIKVDCRVLVMLAGMIQNDFELAIVPAFMAASKACLMYRHSRIYTLSTTLTLEKYRLAGFAILKELALKRIFSISRDTYQNDNLSKYGKCFFSPAISLNQIIINSKVSGSENCPAVITLRDDIEKIYQEQEQGWGFFW